MSDTLTGLGGGCHGFQHGVPKSTLQPIQLFEGCDSHAVTNAAVICHFTFPVYFHSFTRGLFGLLGNLKSIGDRIKNDKMLVGTLNWNPDYGWTNRLTVIFIPFQSHVVCNQIL